MTYIVFELKVEQQQQQQPIPSECLNNPNTTTTTTCDWPPSLNSGRWVSREDLNDSAISTATRKASYVCMFICACVCFT